MIECLLVIITLGVGLNTLMLTFLSLEVEKANIRIDFIEFLIKLYNEGAK